MRPEDTGGDFTPAHRGGSGEPLLLIHGFTDTWRTWELVLPALERRHDVLAPTLAGHAGGPPLNGGSPDEAMLDALEAAMDAAGFQTAHIAGNSLGGYLALRLAARGRARTVVALAPAGGWAADDDAHHETLEYFTRVRAQTQAALPYLDELMANEKGRRVATLNTTVNYRHIPAELLSHAAVGVVACEGAPRLIEHGITQAWSLDPALVACPLRIVWGAEDRILPWPAAAVRYREQFPSADWVLLDGVGHLVQLDVPEATADLIVGLTG